MTWPDVKKILTTPPPPRPPPPKAPLFTTDPFSTKSFGPGHLVGAGVLVFGLYGLTKYFISRSRAQAEDTRRYLAQQQPLPAGSPGRPPQEPREPTLARAENQRGEYGNKR